MHSRRKATHVTLRRTRQDHEEIEIVLVGTWAAGILFLMQVIRP